MDTQSTYERFNAVLHRFQSKVDSRAEIVRMTQWTDDVNQAFDALQIQLESHRKAIQARLLEPIAARDNGRHERQIAELEETDQRITELCDLVKTSIAAFAVGDLASASDDPNIAKEQARELELYRAELIDRSHELIAWIKKQQALITSWFAELPAGLPKHFVEQTVEQNPQCNVET